MNGLLHGVEDGQAVEDQNLLIPIPERPPNEAIQTLQRGGKPTNLVIGHRQDVLDFVDEEGHFTDVRLEEKEGPDWLDKLPKKTKEFAEARQKTAFADSWLEGEKSDLLGFVDFGQLASIIVEKWSCFEDIVPSQHWLKQRMDELEKARNFIAHNRMLLPTEFQRVYMYIADWNRAIGL